MVEEKFRWDPAAPHIIAIIHDDSFDAIMTGARSMTETYLRYLHRHPSGDELKLIMDEVFIQRIEELKLLRIELEKNKLLRRKYEI